MQNDPSPKREGCGTASIAFRTLPVGGTIAMMGKKERVFSPLSHDISLGDLLPEDNFYRRLEAALDLSFVRELVRPLYAGGCYAL